MLISENIGVPVKHVHFVCRHPTCSRCTHSPCTHDGNVILKINPQIRQRSLHLRPWFGHAVARNPSLVTQLARYKSQQALNSAANPRDWKTLPTSLSCEQWSEIRLTHFDLSQAASVKRLWSDRISGRCWKSFQLWTEGKEGKERK